MGAEGRVEALVATGCCSGGSVGQTGGKTL